MEKNKVIQELGGDLAAHMVVLGHALTKVGRLQTFIDLRAKLAEAVYQNRSELRGKGLKAYPELVAPFVEATGSNLFFDLVTDTRLETHGTICGWYEIAKKLGITDPPLCDGLCRAQANALCKVLAPGYSKKIVKSLWRGDNECRFIIDKF